MSCLKCSHFEVCFIARNASLAIKRNLRKFKPVNEKTPVKEVYKVMAKFCIHCNGGRIEI